MLTTMASPVSVECLRPGCVVSSLEQDTGDAYSSSALMDQPFASSAMGDSMDADLLPELFGEMWVVAIYFEEVTADLPPADSEPDLIIASRLDETLITVRKWIQAGSAPSWSECSGLSPDYGAGGYSSGTCQSTQMADYGAAGPLRQ